MNELPPDAIVTYPVALAVADDYPVAFVTDLAVQHSPHEVILTFFAAIPPLEAGNMIVDGVPQPVRARVVARMAIPASRYAALIALMQEVPRPFEDGLT